MLAKGQYLHGMWEVKATYVWESLGDDPHDHCQAQGSEHEHQVPPPRRVPFENIDVHSE
jgi:hypothetical protein